MSDPLSAVILNEVHKLSLSVGGGDAVKALFTLLSKDGVTGSEIDEFSLTPTGQAAWTQVNWFPTVVLDNYTIMESLASSQIAMGMIVNNANSMQSIIASSTAMSAIAANSTAMEAIITSPTALTAIAANPTAMDAIVANPTALAVVIASPTALTAIAASSIAMDAIVESSTAMTTIIESSTAMAAIIASSTASIKLEPLLQTAEMRTSLLLTLSDSSKFTKTTLSNVGAATQDITVGAETNSIYLPFIGGYATYVQLYSVIRPDVLLRDGFPNSQPINQYATLRGARVTNDYGRVHENMYLDFDVYIVI